MSVARAAKASTFAAPASPASRLRLTPIGLCARLAPLLTGGNLKMEPLP